jgi:hypothetical protein
MVDISERLAAAEGYAITEYGLEVFRDLTEPEWQVIGHRIRRRSDGAAWSLGDWLVYGGGRRGSGGRWIGSSYEHAQTITGYSASHLSNCYRVATAFPRTDRIMGLSFDHHRQSLALDQVIRLATLQRALEQGQTAQTLATEVAAIVKRPGRAKDYQPVQVKCPNCEHVFPARANRYSPPGGEPASAMRP